MCRLLIYVNIFIKKKKIINKYFFDNFWIEAQFFYFDLELSFRKPEQLQ